ncbi:MAG: GTP-binding protein [Lentimicrobium sp.]|jgi:G3E family GTPase|nr:GTP-binding protein [Lentimicrobium sp.]
MEKIPVNIITGFLGAGKTTAIIQLLNEKKTEEKWAIIINEFGKILIDSKTLQSSTIAGNVYDISGGCICCSAKYYFYENLNEVIRTAKFSRIIIEPSGLGGIEMVSGIIESISTLVLMPTICMVDIHLLDNLRIQQLPIYRMQIIKSDIVVFTKCDLITDKSHELELKNKFRTIYPEKMMHPYPDISALLYDYPSVNHGKKNFHLINQDNNDFDDRNYQKKLLIFDADISFNPEKLLEILSKHAVILRAKGHIYCNNRWVLMNYTLSDFNIKPCDSQLQNEIVIITGKTDAGFFNLIEQEIQYAIIC